MLDDIRDLIGVYKRQRTERRYLRAIGDAMTQEMADHERSMRAAGHTALVSPLESEFTSWRGEFKRG